ncbi:kinase-like domain-containing protein [Mycena leptocephala]|nr:kinase-like domain-containing protein [Mycena leptocephala]
MPEPLGPSLVANAAFEADRARLEATRARLKLPPANPNSKNPVVGTRLNTGTLLAHEHGGGLPGDSLIMICWEVRSSKNSKIDPRLGSASKKWSTNLFLNDIKSDVMQAVNIEWNKQTLVPLEDAETSFRWSDNRILDRNTSTMTLGDFYTYHSTPSNAPLYLHNVPKKWKHFLKTAKNSPFICLELYIHYDAWQQRKEAIENQEIAPSASRIYSSRTDEVTGQKIGRTESSRNATTQKNKQTRQSGSGARLHSKKCITAIQTGKTTLLDSGDIFHGHIFDKPFSSGTIKQAFDLILDNGEQYVAKCFYKLAESEDNFTIDSKAPVSVEANRVEIEGEICRLAIGKWMLEAFYRHCKSRKDVSVDTNIAFADAFLAVEVDRPSVASGVHMITDDDDGLTWLVERKRPSTVTKFSGTLVHRSHRKDLCSATISAFAHFVFGYSKCSLVVADLQGTPCLVRNNDGLILFDLMTHTTDGDSGFGDFGLQGIATFVNDHTCTDLCRSLSLDTDLIVLIVLIHILLLQ